MIRAKMDFNIRSKLTGHKVQGLDPSYDRREESEYIQEYVDKGIDFLTISNEARKDKQIEVLKQEVTRFDKMQQQINDLTKRLGLE